MAPPAADSSILRGATAQHRAAPPRHHPHHNHNHHRPRSSSSSSFADAPAPAGIDHAAAPAIVGLRRPSTPPGAPPRESRRSASRLSFGTVCSSNINRSMEAHVVLQNAGLRVESYGTGTQVRLPGKSAMEPRIFKFGTPYAEMYRSLAATPEDEAFFLHNGVLQLCKRGASVKAAPQRWQDMTSQFIQTHDVVIAFEERIYDAVVEDLQTREPTEDFKALHVICLDTKDNPHEAKLQGRVALELCWLLERTTVDLDSEAPELVDRFQQEMMTHTQIQVLHQICYL